MTKNGTKPGHVSLCLHFQKTQWSYPDRMTSRFHSFLFVLWAGGKPPENLQLTEWRFLLSPPPLYSFIQTPGEIIQDRLEIILNTWIKFGYVPSPAEVSEKEGIDIFNSKSESCVCILTAFWYNELFQELGVWTRNFVFIRQRILAYKNRELEHQGSDSEVVIDGHEICEQQRLLLHLPGDLWCFGKKRRSGSLNEELVELLPLVMLTYYRIFRDLFCWNSAKYPAFSKRWSWHFRCYYGFVAGNCSWFHQTMFFSGIFFIILG